MHCALACLCIGGVLVTHWLCFAAVSRVFDLGFSLEIRVGLSFDLFCFEI